MPKSKFSEEQKKQVQEWVETKWKSPICVYCGTSQWQVVDSNYALIELAPNGAVVLGRSLPVVPLGCTNCGQLVFLSALMVGTYSQKPAVGGSKDG